ncbi:hypothetical protein BU24DRAFT_481017 [Aaosphaeria arxii CBS 175.79]|uniref:Uncharacterized protein n=1 Tax=Aaosphaeria arxii CBS 175.79 TaxID=1450172 RepID=A0A6A5XU12_9PLEO|nr:uncharacterized protein BU24DRAFT_481017 [Aaosphaeria arxii CBS 175.79]KAF2016406.1 hypothetical protein BU24DRAFT_481017 [Aaosphaeria arxii CBS 175.79]
MPSAQNLSARGPFAAICLANRYDKFKLLEDDSVLPPDLDYPIHPLFDHSNFSNTPPEVYQTLEQCLRLASTFLHDDSVLEWFVIPLFGLPLFDVQSGKTYLSDPLIDKTPREKKALVQEVSVALKCLAHCVRFEFFKTTSSGKFYARTLMDSRRPLHDNSSCTPHFKQSMSALIQLRKQYWEFLTQYYAKASMCEKLRHDFCLATAILHEVTHAVGILRRGDMKEPHIRLDHLATPEFGFAWENFMFGGVINPLNRSSSHVSHLMRKVWQDDETAMKFGGKEWSSVPMSYIAQWFRKDTWKQISKYGPTAVPPPEVSLKLRFETTYYTLLTDNKDTAAFFSRIRSKLAHRFCNQESTLTAMSMFILQLKVEKVDTIALQKPNLPLPSRLGSTSSRLPVENVMKRLSSSRNLRPRPLPYSGPRRTGSYTQLKRSSESDGCHRKDPRPAKRQKR